MGRCSQKALEGYRLVSEPFGGFVRRSRSFWGQLNRFRAILVGLILSGGFLVLLLILRGSSFTADPLTDIYLEMAGSLIAFTFAANALVRFRGTHDRISLILAFGFVLAGLIEAGTSMTFYRGVLVAALPGNHIPIGWLAGRTLLGMLLVAALIVERRVPVSREPAKEMAVATLIVGAVAYLTSVFYFMLPAAPKIHPGTVVPRHWDLVPAVIFIVAAVLGAIAHLTISQSQHVLDAAATVAHLLVVLSYVVVLGGTLLDNAQLFDQVSRLASSDPLTGLANHRRLFEVLERELQRSQRTGRSFALLLFDLDGLKKINDKYGHLTGSRAIRRLGMALRSSSRTIDTPARYGGDEFALVLPESGAHEAKQAAIRICEQLAHDGEQPAISVSVGVAVYPAQGASIEKLLASADRALYRMKGRGERKLKFPHAAACL
jgi:diguanylate cyclase (GGDEF)-like protein